jgi:DedD protein
VITESREEAGRSVAPAPAAAPEPAAKPVDARPDAKPEARPESKPDAKPDAKPEPKPAAKPEAKPTAAAEAAKARALLEGKVAVATPAATQTPPSTDSDAGRFVVQVGAFADAAAARETRLKVEKLGMKTYTQVANTPAGNRIRVRVGPFGTRDEAAKAQAKAKGAGLTAVVLTL